MLMRSVWIAIWTSGDPVSPFFLAKSVTIRALSPVVTAMGVCSACSIFVSMNQSF
jgi:hypothetical protein